MKRPTTALVTGGGRGIGKETAILLAKKGMNVVICSRTQGEIDSAVKEIKSMGNNQIIGKKCDVSKSDEVINLVKEILVKYGRIDVLVNNAGITYVKKLVDTTEEEWDHTLDINLKGVFLLSKAILPQMMKNNFGVIINVSSGAGKVGLEDISVYCASKFGIMGLTESVAWEVGNYDITVMTLCPGEVATKMQKDVDPQYYELNKHKMLHPKTVAEKITDMVFDDKKYGLNHIQGLEISPDRYLLTVEDQLKPSFQIYNLREKILHSNNLYGFPTVSNTVDYTNYLGESGRTKNVLAIVNGKGSFLFSYSNSAKAYDGYLPTVNQIIKSIVILK
jgi:3-oxoacyl-[acyl-carrier protein] reductase